MMTVTDNGSNMVQAFSEYASDDASDSDASMQEADDDSSVTFTDVEL